jgi:hypothetical protein
MVPAGPATVPRGKAGLMLCGLFQGLHGFLLSGEVRNPDFSGYLCPGFPWGDSGDKGIILKLTALGSTPRPHAG